MSFQIGSYKSPTDSKRAAIEAARSKSSGPTPENAKLIRYIPSGECSDRNRIVFDDSVSMSGQIRNAITGVVEYLKNCIPNQTAVAVHFMNSKSWSPTLRSDLPQLALDIQEASLSSGSTPFFNTLKHSLEATPRATRVIAFTDGYPTDSLQAESNSEMQTIAWGASNTDVWKQSANFIIKIAKSFGEKCIPIDTVYFGEANERTKQNIDLLKYLSEQTGGYFLHFNPAKMNFATAFKYLAPVYRLQLASSSFRAAVESGEKK